MPTASPPPRRRDLPVVFYAHPFEIAVAAAFILIGLRFLIEGDTSPAVDRLHPIPLGIYRAGSVVGGIGILVGLGNRAKPIGRTLERASLYVVAGAWAAWAVIILDGYSWNRAAPTAAITLLVAAACWLRARAIGKTERVILAQLRTLNGDPVLLRRMVDGRPPTVEE